MDIVEKIIDKIYYYYPKGILMDHLGTYERTVEYKRREKICEEARENDGLWQELLNEIEAKLIKTGRKVTDYSVLQDYPCYHGAFSIPEENEGVAFIIDISVIVPYWAYRIFDREERKQRYYPIGTWEHGVITQLTDLVAKYYPDRLFLEEKIHQHPVEDVDMLIWDDLTIYDLVFTRLEG